MKDITSYIETDINSLWALTLIGAVCVVGLINFIKNWYKKKFLIQMAVLFVSFGVALTLSSIVPSVISTMVILWLLILSVATIARDAIVDGIPKLISRMMGGKKDGN